MRIMRRLALAGRTVLCRFHADRGGSMLTWIGVSVIPLLISVGMATDISRGYLMRSKLNTALDAAALAGGRDINLDEDVRDATIQRYFEANLPPGFMDASVSPLEIRKIQISGAPDRLEVTARSQVPSLFMRLVGVDMFPVAASSEITVASRSVEVALALDITGSMAGTRLADLKVAAKQLIDIVVQDDQDPFYSKVALAPYAAAVNAGPWAAVVRGDIPGPANITAASKQNPVRITTATPHGLVNGDKVQIVGVSGMTQINFNKYTVSNATATDFRLRNAANTANIDGSGFNTYSGNGIVGKVCQGPGCTFNEFTSQTGSLRAYLISTCVSERIGAEAYTDVVPSGPGSHVGTVYPNTPFASPNTPSSQFNPCPAASITPLSDDKAFLKSQIDSYAAAGSTAGALGNAWAWYLVSEDFGSIFPEPSRPGENVPADLLKAVVLMTDGEFNTVYCNGILSRSSTSGSGDDLYKINCNAPNGSSNQQANSYCDAIKSDGIIVFTVGFGFTSPPPNNSPINTCASDPSRVFLANSGAELSQAFREIGLSISRLRLSR